MISLCMICGNEAGTILRCLESARDAFDQLCLVRAVGTQAPDETVALAKSWALRNNKAIHTAEYINEHRLPHIDNFAAARNQSFGLATCDWLLWLDCDDYLDEINCRRIREAVAEYGEKYNALWCNYQVEKHGCTLIRERLIKRGCGTWRRAIHEVCEITGESAKCPQIVVYHGDHTHKHVSSAARNKVILERELTYAPRHYFYLHGECKLTGDMDGARRYANAALALLPDDADEERYITHLHLSELEPDNTANHLMQCLRIHPHRREAYAYLCQKAIIDGDMSAAVSWFRCMDVHPVPVVLPWTHQGIWYSGGWARDFLRVRVLRFTGQIAQADADHARYMANPEYAAGVAEWHQKHGDAI